MDEFHQALTRHSAPTLATYSYKFDEELRDRNIIFGYSKELCDGIYSIILFQRHQFDEQVEGYDFRIILQRRRLGEEVYEGAQNIELHNVLKHVFKLEHFPDYFWWHVDDPSGYGGALEDSLQYIEKYGIPWLEDLDSRSLDHVPPEERKEFADRLSDLASPMISNLGYLCIVEWEHYKVRLYKKLNGDRYSHIVYILGSRLDPPTKFFYIMLIRNGSKDDLDFASRDLYCHFGGWLFEEHKDTYQLAEWCYSTTAELVENIQDSVEKLQTYAIPWLEDSVSTNPYESG